jgi:hypothetical protein
MNGAAAAITKQIDQRREQQRADLQAQKMLGLINGKPTLEAKKLPSEIAANEANSIKGKLLVEEITQKQKRMLAAQDRLQKTENDIDGLEMAKVITPEEAAIRREAARNLHQRSLVEIQSATPAITPRPGQPPAAAPTQPPGSTRKWAPGTGVQ